MTLIREERIRKITALMAHFILFEEDYIKASVGMAILEELLKDAEAMPEEKEEEKK